MRARSLKLFSCLVMAAAVSPTATAQNRALQQRLENASRVECRFTQVATGDWGQETTQFDAEPVDFTATFFDIDVESGTAEAEGRFGASYIIVRHVAGYLHFMQLLNSGPLYLTTVLAQPAQDGRLKAVHARHEYTEVRLPGFTSRPEMYLGDCAIE